MNSLFDKLIKGIDTYSKNNKKFSEDVKKRGGREAEYKVFCDLKERTSGTNWDVFTKLRVPCSADFSRNGKIKGQRREIDFLIITPNEVLVIELKNWSGYIEIKNNGDVYQKKDNQPIIEHGKIFDDLKNKTKILKSIHLTKNDNCPNIRSLVVFFSKKGILGDSLRSRKDVLTYDQLSMNIPKTSQEGNSSIIYLIIVQILKLFGFEKISSRNEVIPKEIIDFKNTVSAFGSWDVLELNGECVLFGDFLQEELIKRNIHKKIYVETEKSLFANIIENKDSSKVIIHHISNKIEIIECKSDLAVKFQEAGSNLPENFLLRNIKSIEIGYSKPPKLSFFIEDLEIQKKLSGIVVEILDNVIRVNVGYFYRNGNIKINYNFSIWKNNRNNIHENLKVGDRVVVSVKDLNPHTQQVSANIITIIE